MIHLAARKPAESVLALPVADSFNQTLTVGGGQCFYGPRRIVGIQEQDLSGETLPLHDQPPKTRRHQVIAPGLLGCRRFPSAGLPETLFTAAGFPDRRFGVWSAICGSGWGMEPADGPARFGSFFSASFRSTSR
jgi:hypothetical protein